jgi:hypothetical protein
VNAGPDLTYLLRGMIGFGGVRGLTFLHTQVCDGLISLPMKGGLYGYKKAVTERKYKSRKGNEG